MGAILSNTFFIDYKLNFIAVGYRRDLCMLKSPLYKIFHKAVNSIVPVFAFWEERDQLELF